MDYMYWNTYCIKYFHLFYINNIGILLSYELLFTDAPCSVYYLWF
jgi:hypothetical protein